MLATEIKAVASPATAAPLSVDPARVWKLIVEPVKPFLGAVSQRLSEQVREFEPEIAEYAEYALAGRGKQLRPLLVALSADAAGGVEDRHVTIAVIIEMVHLATLVHDDVMDAAEIRRGQPTLAANWGNEISVLLGDCLFAHALKLAASFPTPDVCRAVSAATNTVCSGEILQTQRRGNFHVSREEYFRMLAMKTATLFSLSRELGGCLGGGNGVKRESLRQYGLALGTAYQVYDDCLDLFGSEGAAGKSLGIDLAGGKLTLPVLVALERSSASEKARLEAQVRHWEPGHFSSVLRILEKYDTLAESQRIVCGYLRTAREELGALPASKGREGLLGLAEYLEQQMEALGVLS
jgi:octaprenyl-diphosphate synthase